MTKAKREILYFRAAAVFSFLLISLPLSVFAQNADGVAKFYQGKQVKFILGHDVGGDYDIGGRLLARYLVKYVPGYPSTVVQNMPGANSLVATNYLFNVAPKDGTVIGSFSRNIPSDAVRGLRNLKATPTQFGWIGATSKPSRICIAEAATGVDSVEILLNRPLIVGGTGTGGIQSFIPNAVNRLLGTKFKVVEGYKGHSDLMIALERGEINGLCSVLDLLLASHDESIKAGKYKVLFHTEETALSELPSTPSIFSYVSSDRDQQVLRLLFSSAVFGRPYATPPDVPTERLQALRLAFDKAVEDAEFLAEAKRLQLDVRAKTGDELARLVALLQETPQDVVVAANEIVPSNR